MYDQLQKAFECAALSHQEPRKGSDIPYISHLLAVTALILEVGGTEEEACAGMLHDVLEDTNIDAERMGTDFGTKIAALIDGDILRIWDIVPVQNGDATVEIGDDISRTCHPNVATNITDVEGYSRIDEWHEDLQWRLARF